MKNGFMLKNLWNKFIYFLIYLIEKYEYRNLSLDQDDSNKKIINSIPLTDLEIQTDSGWKPITSIHITQPYDIWQIKTEHGYELECADNHIVFNAFYDEVFVQNLRVGHRIITQSGADKITSIKKLNVKPISMYDVSVDSDTHRFWSNGILSHNTITSSVYLTWYLLFHFDRNVLLLANIGTTTKEIIDKIRHVVEGLPFYMKPGINKKDVFTLGFDNGCRLIGANTTLTGGIGFTIHLLFLDEFAHIKETIKRKFYENVYPTLSSSKVSRVIITSTPNGMDLFHDLYQGAVKGLNEYAPIRVDWWQIPGRDEAWKLQEISNLGSEEAFNQQYGCQFLSTSTLLLSSTELKRIISDQVEYQFHEFDELDELNIDYSGLRFHPDFDIDDIIGDDKFYTFTIDLAEGVGRDYSIINIFQLQVLSKEDRELVKSPGGIFDFFGYKQVGLFRSNQLDIDEIAKILYTLVVKIFDQENVKNLIEFNTYGSALIANIFALYPQNNEFNDECIVKFSHRMGSKIKKFGLRLNSENKKFICERAKIAIKGGRILINEKNTVMESSLFTRKSNGSYAAEAGHDDAIQTTVNLSAMFDTVDFQNMCEELFELLPIDIQDEINKIFEDDADVTDDIKGFLDAIDF